MEYDKLNEEAILNKFIYEDEWDADEYKQTKGLFRLICKVCEKEFMKLKKSQAQTCNVNCAAILGQRTFQERKIEEARLRKERKKFWKKINEQLGIEYP